MFYDSTPKTTPHISKIRSVIFCRICSTQITDRFYYQVQNCSYHSHCLRCYKCNLLLSNCCFFKEPEGIALCKLHYLEKIKLNCSACSLAFTSKDKVIRISSSFYHHSCFKCCTCSKQFTSGENVSLLSDGKLYCIPDFKLGIRTNFSALL